MLGIQKLFLKDFCARIPEALENVLQTIFVKDVQLSLPEFAFGLFSEKLPSESKIS